MQSIFPASLFSDVCTVRMAISSICCISFIFCTSLQFFYFSIFIYFYCPFFSIFFFFFFSQLSQAKARSMMDFASDGKMLKVQSCFGGLTIYRYDALEGCKYGYRHTDPPYMLDCEHVLLHKCMVEKNKAKIFSNSKM